MDIKQIGNEVKNLRIERGLTRYKITKRTQIANQVQVSIEQGNKDYTLKTLLKLLKSYGKTLKIVDYENHTS